VDIREIDRDDEVLVHRHWEIGKLADAVRPYDFYPLWETAWKSYQAGRDDIEMNLLGAFDGDLMVGAARADVPVLDNLHTAYTFVSVDPAHQRRGVGRALDGAVVDKARSLGRRLVMTEAFAPPESDSPGLLFARAMGYATGLQDGMKVVDQFATAARVSAIELDVHHRLAAALVVAQRLQRLEDAIVVAIDAHHRMQQPVDRQRTPGDCIGNRVDQEGHVVVDDAEPHSSAAGFTSGRFEADRDFALAPLVGHFGDETRRFFLFLGAKAVEFPGKCIANERLLQRVDRRRFSARDYRHVLLPLRMSAIGRGLVPEAA